MYTARNYIKAQSLAQAYELNQRRANAILGGGCWMRMGERMYDTLIDLSGLGLDQIQDRGEEAALGAMVTLRQLETNFMLEKCFDGLFRKCTQHIVGVQFRNCATLGGSVYSRFGFSDIVTALLALSCQVELAGAGRIPLEEYVKQPRDRDVLSWVYVKKDGRSVAYETARNSETDLPVLTCALSKVGESWRAVIGARPGSPRVVEDSSWEGLEKQVLALEYGDNMRGSAKYRRHLAGVLLKRCREQLEVSGV